MIKANELSQLLSEQAERVARYLLPHGRKVGCEWQVGDINNATGKSLSIRLSGDKAGIWCDFAEDQHRGDLLDLWVRVRSLRLPDAMAEATQFLGASTVKFTGHEKSSFQKPEVKLVNPSSMDGLSPQFDYLMNERKLNLKTLQDFNIAVSNERIVFPYIRNDEVIFVKYLSLNRVNGKKQMSVEANCQPCLFGWQTVDTSKPLVICEGEIDAMTLYQYGFSAVSVPLGAGIGAKHKWIEFEFDRLEMFKEIYLCMDNDEEGQKAADYLASRLGHYRCRIVKLPCKDANECLMSGLTAEEVMHYFKNSLTMDPSELMPAVEYCDRVKDWFYPPEGMIQGYTAPWVKTHDKVLFRANELSIWTGINGHGKSQFLGHLMLDQIRQGAKVCVASLELRPHILLGKMTRQAAALKTPSEPFIDEVFKFYKDQLWIFDLVGTASHQRLLEVFLYARQKYGVDVFVIDSFLKLDIAEDDYKNQKAFLNQLCDFKNDHNCHVHLVVHPRKGADESYCPGKLDAKGTGAISDLADNCFGVWRNKEKETILNLQKMGISLGASQLEKLNYPDAYWYCDKQRSGDWEGKFAFWFDKNSGQFLGSASCRPIPFVEFSIHENHGVW